MSSFSQPPRALAPAENPDPEDAPRAQDAPRDMSALRGEEFDVSTLRDPDEAPASGAPGSKWNRAWLAVAGLLAAYCFYFWVYGLGVHAQKPLPLGPIAAKAGVARVRVHVAGAVVHPGVYSLGADARVFDALQKAGGAARGADPDALNLAAFVEDGAKIQVPLKPALAPKTTPTPVVIIREVPVAAPPSEAVSAPPPAPPMTTTAPDVAVGSSPRPVTAPAKAGSSGAKKSDNAAFLRAHPIDLNHATSVQLQQLPGVGPKMAERILAFRSENGRFKSLADLDSVKGIGEKKMDALKDLVTVK